MKQINQMEKYKNVVDILELEDMSPRIAKSIKDKLNSLDIKNLDLLNEHKIKALSVFKAYVE